MATLWQPSASLDTLHKRAAIMQNIRKFFAARTVLEVETPCLSAHTITDPYLEAMHTLHTQPGACNSSRLYLQTSPEYAMKRLLAAGSGDIFQLCKAFRDDEVGRMHNPEFTMLEWYRVGYSMQQLIDEVAALLIATLPIDQVHQSNYRRLFEKHLEIDPLETDLATLIALCNKLGLSDYVTSLQTNLNTNESEQGNAVLKDSILQVLFSMHIEPHIGTQCPMVVCFFPASQASLATLSDDGKTANRFEVFYKGIELANGFDELTDAQSQLNRFEQDNQKRIALGLSTKPIDKHFMAALKVGLPQCAGVAIGVDRLIMLALQKDNIEEVTSFSHRNC
ncbi:MAG: lysyl-tRNA synthetase class 2 [Alphaproteobacteria bacterium]|jgi:lysyl-tRNA synthetase class 2